MNQALLYALVFLSPLLPVSAFSQTKYQKDFQQFWTDVNNHYAFYWQLCKGKSTFTKKIDPLIVKQFLGFCNDRKRNWNGRIARNLLPILQHGRELIAMLDKEYHFEWELAAGYLPKLNAKCWIELLLYKSVTQQKLNRITPGGLEILRYKLFHHLLNQVRRPKVK